MFTVKFDLEKDGRKIVMMALNVPVTRIDFANMIYKHPDLGQVKITEIEPVGK